MTVRAALIQQSCGPDREANLSKSEMMARNAAAQGAGLIVLPELHAGPYFCQSEDTSYFNWAEPIPGPGTERFGALAQELGVVLIASLFERRTAGLYHNTAVIFERDGSIAGKYRKMHIPDDPG
ncbi:MAG: acyltransferase, partial [Candidatus Hydrogenedentes bacterium]|nr:acyltransferase [Candidatus Hydrogenedentota bacterium]